MGKGNRPPARPVPRPPPPVVKPCPPPPDIEITDQTGAVVSGTLNRMVGQRIQLRVRSTPTGSALTNIQWTIQADTVKTYTQSITTGTATPLAAADLQVDNVSFYWISGAFAGASKTVTVAATVAGAAKTKTVTFTVFRPRVDRFDTTVSAITISVGGSYGPGTRMAAYQPPSTPGIQWDAQVTAPAAGGGQIAFTQLINDSRALTYNTGQRFRESSKGAFVLDDGLGIQYMGPKPIGGPGVNTLDGPNYADSPGNPLEGRYKSTSFDLKFELYLMYRPTGADSIWVTLGMATWGATGQTTRKGPPAANTWNAPTGTSLPHTNGLDSTALPQWTDKFTSLTWVLEPGGP